MVWVLLLLCLLLLLLCLLLLLFHGMGAAGAMLDVAIYMLVVSTCITGILKS
jgi:hypothetical protein